MFSTFGIPLDELGQQQAEASPDIDHPASVALTQREGHCPADDHGLHTVVRGTTHCRDCGCR